MNEVALTPEACRARAQMCRDMARQHSDPQKRKEFEDIASAWEQLCEELDKLAKGKEAR
jgi:hypothetical protein